MTSTGVASVDITYGADYGSHNWTGLTDVIRAVYSQEIRLAEQPMLRFKQFAQHRTELGTQPGNTISMITFDNLARGGKLAEGTHIETKALGTSMKHIKVFEYGNALAATEYLLRSSFVDVMANGTLLLANDSAWVQDYELGRSCFGATNVFYPSSAYVSRSQITSTDTLSTSQIRDAVERLSTNKAPKFSGLGRDAYVCIISPHQLRDLKDDDDWQSANEYAGAANIFQGEIGRFDDVIFVETTMAPYIQYTDEVIYVDNEATTRTSTNGASVDVYVGFMFGADAFGYAEGLQVELRDNGVTDFGRERALAWYSIYGVQPDLGAGFSYLPLDQNRIVRMETA